MLNITTIEKGFILNDSTYTFENFMDNDESVSHEMVSESQVHIGTDKGVILLDLTCSIEGIQFTDIAEFVKALKL